MVIREINSPVDNSKNGGYLKSRSFEGVNFNAFAILSMVSIFTAPGLLDSRR